MTFDGINGPRYTPKGNSTATGIDNTTRKIEDDIVTFLGLPRIRDFSPNNISHEGVRKKIIDGNFHIRGFDNGYTAIIEYIDMNSKKVEMGTGFALVTDTYISGRGKIQGIMIAEESTPIGSINYIDQEGTQRTTNIYFVGAGSLDDGTPVGIAYSKNDIDENL